MNWFQKIFSGKADISKVNVIGLVMMAIAILIVVFSGKLAKMLKSGDELNKKNMIKLIGVVICAAGALIAIIGK